MDVVKTTGDKISGALWGLRPRGNKMTTVDGMKKEKRERSGKNERGGGTEGTNEETRFSVKNRIWMRGGELDDVKRKVKVNKDGRMGEREKKEIRRGKERDA